MLEDISNQHHPYASTPAPKRQATNAALLPNTNTSGALAVMNTNPNTSYKLPQNQNHQQQLFHQQHNHQHQEHHINHHQVDATPSSSSLRAICSNLSLSLSPAGACLRATAGPRSVTVASYHYLEELHETHRLNESRMTKQRLRGGLDAVQTEVTQHMRAILVDWLVEVAMEFNLGTQTLFLSVNYLDRMLESVPIPTTTLQLVGITCMLIAAKYEEIVPPSVSDFVEVTDGTYTKEEVRESFRVVRTAL